MWDHGAETNGSISVAPVPKAFGVCVTKKNNKQLPPMEDKNSSLRKNQAKTTGLFNLLKNSCHDINNL